MRVTSTMSLRNTMRDLSSSLERLQNAQQRLSSGKQHERVSDDPRAATDVLFLRGRLARHDQVARTADDTRTRLASADTTLVGISDSMVRVKELAVRAGNTGVSDPVVQATLATEVRSMREQLLSEANAEYLGRSLFSGTAAGAAYDTTTGAFQGNAAVEGRTVAEGLRLPANITGEQIFGDQSSPTGDLFAMLDRLATAIDNDDDAAIATESNNLDQARLQLGSAMAEVGRRVSQLDDIEQDSAVRREQLVGRLSAIEDVDLAEAVIDMTTRETAHQAALAAAARAMPPSLSDYLR